MFFIPGTNAKSYPSDRGVGLSANVKLPTLCKTRSERHPPAEVRHDGKKGDFFPRFSVRVEVQHEGVEVVGDVADADIDTVLGAAGQTAAEQLLKPKTNKFSSSASKIIQNLYIFASEWIIQ